MSKKIKPYLKFEDLEFTLTDAPKQVFKVVFLVEHIIGK